MRYLLFATIGTLLFFGVYWLLMRKEARFQLVRGYLLGTLALSLLLPLIHITIHTSVPLTTQTQLEDNEEEASAMHGTPALQTIATTPATQSGEIKNEIVSDKMAMAAPIHYSPYSILLSLYLAGCAVALLLFSVRLVRTCSRLRRLDYTKHDGILTAIVEEPIPAFSFLNRIVICRNSFDENELQLLIGHEQVHVRQHHSLDILFVELVKVAIWFNPVVWLYERELKRVHEYLADREMLAQPQGSDYVALFYHQVSGRRYSTLGNNFDYSITKKRITMMTQSKNRFGGLTPLLALPIAVLLLFANCKTENGLKGTFEISRITLMSDNPQEPDVVCSEFFDLEAYSFTFHPNGKVEIECTGAPDATIKGTYTYDGQELTILNAAGKSWVTLDMNTLHCDNDSIALLFTDPNPLDGLNKALNDFHVLKYRIDTVEISNDVREVDGYHIVCNPEQVTDTMFAHIITIYDSKDTASEGILTWNADSRSRNRLLGAATATEDGAIVFARVRYEEVTKSGKKKDVFGTIWELQHNRISPKAQHMYDAGPSLTLNPRMEGDRFILQVELKKK